MCEAGSLDRAQHYYTATTEFPALFLSVGVGRETVSKTVLQGS